MAENDYKSWIAKGHYHSLIDELPHSFQGVQKYIPTEGPNENFPINSEYNPKKDGITLIFDVAFSREFHDFAHRFTFKKRKSTDKFLIAEADSQENDPYLSPNEGFNLLSWTLTKGETILVEEGDKQLKKIVLGVTTMTWLKNENSKIATISWKWQGYKD